MPPEPAPDAEDALRSTDGLTGAAAAEVAWSAEADHPVRAADAAEAGAAAGNCAEPTAEAGAPTDDEPGSRAEFTGPADASLRADAGHAGTAAVPPEPAPWAADAFRSTDGRTGSAAADGAVRPEDAGQLGAEAGAEAGADGAADAAPADENWTGATAEAGAPADDEPGSRAEFAGPADASLRAEDALHSTDTPMCSAAAEAGVPIRSGAVDGAN
ncbi:hypothetical protein ACIA6C_04185 [Streptomyces sp. NPDC051578]|uniref:hypothetical protein n=1 Tax=Streptomyces sp. NPDC051578 TaxID=3365662 RepID=UPI0037893F4D